MDFLKQADIGDGKGQNAGEGGTGAVREAKPPLRLRKETGEQRQENEG